MTDTTNRTDDLAVIQYGATDPRAVPLPSDRPAPAVEQAAEAQKLSDGALEAEKDDAAEG